MSLAPRQQQILELVRERGYVSIEELAQHFSVTPQTIRRDINQLAEAGLLRRYHGGAAHDSSVENTEYSMRAGQMREEKRLIAEAVAAAVPDHASLFINIGTTTEEVARALGDHEDLLVITNNLNVATLLYRHPKMNLIVAGGPVRRADGAVIGSAAVDFINQFKVDYAVIGASAIDEDGTLLDFDYREVRVARAIIENARRVILVADKLKLERSAPIRVGHLRELDYFVTDALPSASLREMCAAHRVALVEAGAEAPAQETSDAAE